MNFFYDVSIPANTAQTAPFTEILKLAPGVLTSLLIYIPAGHGGTAHLKLYYHEFQLFPLSRNEDYHGDDVPIPIQSSFKIDTEPYEFKAVGWNTDTEFSHAFLLSVNILKEDQISGGSSASLLAELKTLIDSNEGG